jgi:subfamily B ATP-binding cassette protein MsbA
MAAYALLSGFSIGMVYPVIDRVFVDHGQTTAAPPAVTVDPGREVRGLVGDVAGRIREGRFSSLAADVKKIGSRRIETITNGASRRDLLKLVCVTVLILVLLRNVFDYLRKIIFTRVEQSAAEDIRNELYGRIIHLPLSGFDRRHSGALISRAVSDVEAIKNFTVSGAAQAVHNALQVIVYLGITFWVSPQLAFVSLLVLPPVMFLLGRLAVKLKKYSGRAQERLSDITERLQETISAVRVVKAFANEETEVGRFRNATRRYRKTVTRLLSIDLAAAPLSEFWGVSIGVLVLWWGGLQVLDPASGLTAGRFLLFLFAMFSLMHPLKEISGAVGKMQRGLVAADRVFELMDAPSEPLDGGGRAVGGFSSTLRFRNVSFTYDGAIPVLTGIDFEARAGETVAIVGPSGGGKTTLVDLIPRFYEPTSGSIELDGADTRELNLKSLRRLMGIVTQDTILFNETAAANIAYGCPGASREDVEAAARAANAHEFIAALPNGYDTMIGEDGHLLSGGQRQRLAIARAILKNPPILIFDEATSSLDTESEALVQEAIERLLHSRTTFVIAHRLSTVVRADRILVIEGGRIVESGVHEELLQKDGPYRRLYRMQFREEDRIMLGIPSR